MNQHPAGTAREGHVNKSTRLKSIIKLQLMLHLFWRPRIWTCLTLFGSESSIVSVYESLGSMQTHMSEIICHIAKHQNDKCEYYEFYSVEMHSGKTLRLYCWYWSSLCHGNIDNDQFTTLWSHRHLQSFLLKDIVSFILNIITESNDDRIDID